MTSCTPDRAAELLIVQRTSQSHKQVLIFPCIVEHNNSFSVLWCRTQQSWDVGLDPGSDGVWMLYRNVVGRDSAFKLINQSINESINK